MFSTLLTTSIFLLLMGLVVQNMFIRIAFKYKLLDFPSSRRKHANPTPIVGGLGILLTWISGITIYAISDPTWAAKYATSIFTISLGALILTTIGFIDDIKGLSPKWKLPVEFAVAALVIFVDPQLNAICRSWVPHLGVLVWPLAFLWIVGITNAINLIDGLDGLAGGISLLSATAITYLASAQTQGSFAIVTTSLLIPCIVSFLRYNWNPARVFLGDNGSLPLGFILSITGILGQPEPQAWSSFPALLFIMAYPILDMGLAVYRRYQHKFELFKADRIHVHYRLRRLGLSVRSTVTFILMVAFGLQCAAMVFLLPAPDMKYFGLAMVLAGTGNLLYFIRTIEKSRVESLTMSLKRSNQKKLEEKLTTLKLVIKIELATLLEAAMAEEHARYKEIVAAFELMIRSVTRPEDLTFWNGNTLSIMFAAEPTTPSEIQAITVRFQEKIDEFLTLFNLHCSLSGIPIHVEKAAVVSSKLNANVTTVIDEETQKAA